MIVKSLEIPDVKLITPKIFEDERGFFFESFNHQEFEKMLDHKTIISQDNHSKSSKGVLRGLHYQMPPHAQGKLVRVIQGKVFDVAVDIRKNSPTFGKWIGTILSSENKKQLWIPEGFAHGFLTLSDTSEFLYKTTNYYHQASERSIIWNDKTLNIEWPECGKITIAEKDKNAISFEKADYFK